jgi:hypothetical protein
MAPITFDAVQQAAHARDQLKAVLAAVRELLDAFVSNRMRRAAAEAEHAHSRQPSGASSPSISAQ